LAILTFAFVLYATFLTRTGILQNTSVHAFTLDETTKRVTYTMLLLFLGAFTLPALTMYFANLSKIPAIHKEERTDSREFWMFIGALILFLASMFIIAKTSVPVYAEITGSKIAPPKQVEISYNKILLPVTIIIAILSAITQYFKYKSTPTKYIIKKLAIPTVLALIIIFAIAFFNPITYHNPTVGTGFIGAIYVALFASIYSAIANAGYVWSGLKGKLLSAGGSIAHMGFGLMLAGILISSSNKKVISDSSVNGMVLPATQDPMTKEMDDPRENLTLVRTKGTRMGPYDVTYTNVTRGKEKDRRFYELQFVKKDPASQDTLEHFSLFPDVYLTKDNNFTSNPDTKVYLTKDIFTYITYATNENAEDDTAKFKIHEMKPGDTA
ncbi:MAG TPA: cytochrome c-type biogenesis CcmF C-terminal domain-containing protein, partial [Ferruginibacter sp.]|nr:cytochrome c-type biogenesis CcmF C-terminal domain-containing protein [Ferruginibacter sp.]